MVLEPSAALAAAPLSETETGAATPCAAPPAGGSPTHRRSPGWMTLLVERLFQRSRSFTGALNLREIELIVSPGCTRYSMRPDATVTGVPGLTSMFGPSPFSP